MKGWLLRFLYYALPTLALAVIVLAMNAGPLLKRPLGPQEDLPAQLKQVADLALSGRWEEARQGQDRLAQTWVKVKGRLRFSSTTDEIEVFDLLMAELQAAVEGRDQVLLRSAHLRMESLWQDLGS